MVVNGDLSNLGLTGPNLFVFWLSNIAVVNLESANVSIFSVSEIWT